MPKQIWEVADDRKLRRAVGTTQEFVRDRYDTVMVPVHAMHPGSLTVSVGGTTLARVEMPDAADSYVYGALVAPGHWAKGNLKFKMYSTIASTSKTGSWELTVRRSSVEDVAGNLTRTVIAATQNDQAYSTTHNNQMKETGWESGEHDFNDPMDGVLLSWKLGRLGTHANDTANGLVLYLLGVSIAWQPIVATA